MSRPADTLFAGAVLVVAVTAACAPESPAERAGPGEMAAERAASGPGTGGESVVLSVDGETTTRREFDRQIEQMPDYVRARFKSADTKKDLLAALAQFEVFADVAERRGLGESPAVRSALESELERRVVREAVRDRVSIDAISESAVESYYENHPEKYREPERRAALVVATESSDRAHLIREDLLEVEGGVDERIERFRSTASRRSVDPTTAQRGGAVGWVRPPEHEEEYPEIASTVFDLDERGVLSDVFRVDDRWYVATWRQRKEASRQPLEEVASEIRTRLFDERRRELREQVLSEWRSKTEAEISDDLRERLEAPEPPRRTREAEIPIRTAESDDSTHDASRDGTSK